MSNLTILERRLMKLEQLVYERSVNRGEETNAYKIWKFLMDNGPSTADQIKAIFPADKRGTITSNLRGFPTKGVISKNGDLYSANPDYVWDDVGKISRPSLADIQAATAIAAEEPEVETPARKRRQREVTARPTTRQVTANIWSKKLDEVKAAVDGGADVNQHDDKGRTPLSVIVSSKADTSDVIANYLIEHGADVNIMIRDVPLIFKALKEDNVNLAIVIAKHGANLTTMYKGLTPLDYVLDRQILNTDLIESVCNDEVIIRRASRLFIRLVRYEHSGSVSSKFVTKMVNKYMPIVVNNSNARFEVCHSSSWSEQATNKSVSPSILLALLKENTLPRVNKGLVQLLSVEACEAIYNAAKNNNGNLKVYDTAEYIGAVKAICNRLNKSSDFLSDIYSLEYLAKAKDLDAIFSTAVVDKDISLLKKIAKVKRSFRIFMDAIIILARQQDREFTLAACRAMNYSNINTHDAANYLYKSKNVYLIEWFLDKEPSMISDFVRNAHYIGDTAREILRDHGYTNLDDKKVARDLEKSRNKFLGNQLARTRLINSIEYDVFRDARDIVNQHPELLDDEDIIEMINDPANDGSFTARELRKMLNDKPKSKYNF